MISKIKRLFGMNDDPEEIAMIAEVVLGRRDDPSATAESLNITWRPELAKEWERRYSRCSGCNCWVRGRRTVWCEICGRKGF